MTTPYLSVVYTANQPLFLPSIYMMNRYYHSDVLVVMEEAQFTKFGHQSRVEIMTPQGKQYLTIPLKDRDFKPINEVQLADPVRTVGKLKKTLQTNYGKYPGFKEHRESLWRYLDLAAKSTSLAMFNGIMLRWVWDTLGMNTQILTSEVLIGKRPERPSEWVAAMGEAVAADIYLGGGTAQNAYIIEEDFSKRNITLQPQKYKMPTYKSVGDQIVGFEEGDGWVSILDPLLIHGVDMAMYLISKPAY